MQPPIQILALGRFARTKGFDVLLRAAKLLEEQGLDFHLTLAGAGPARGALNYLTRRLGLGPRVSFPGFIPYDRVSALFTAADVFVMPCVIHASSDRDGIPNVIMEALLHRLPVVASDVAGIGEVIRHRDTGLLVPQRDAAALAAAIQAMVADRPAALAMAEEGGTWSSGSSIPPPTTGTAAGPVPRSGKYHASRRFKEKARCAAYVGFINAPASPSNNGSGWTP